MSSPKLPAVRLGEGEHRITVGVACLTWAACWLAGNLLGALVIGATGQEVGTDTTPIWVTVVGAVALWIPILIGLRAVSDRFGTGSMTSDYRLAFRPVDLLGLPIGLVSQLLLLRLLYWPLEEVWPDTFGRANVEETAQRLVDRADGIWFVALVAVVVVGAPLVEELLYRGLLQGAFERRVHAGLAVVLVAGWFAIIHFRPVELPGLFVIGLVLGVCTWRTQRLGMSILAHVAFNAAGLAVVATR
jgi:CAAX protease family protein